MDTPAQSDATRDTPRKTLIEQIPTWVYPTGLIIFLCLGLGIATVVVTPLLEAEEEVAPEAAVAKLILDPIEIEVLVDATRPGQKGGFDHRWKGSFGTAHASVSRRPEWRRDLRRAVSELGLSGVRVTGVLNDDMGLVTSSGAYDFSRLDGLFDFLVTLGVSPIVDLSYMPAVLANCSWAGQCIESRVGCIVSSPGYSCGTCTGRGAPFKPLASSKPCQTLDSYSQGVDQAPSQWALWHDLVRSLAEHLVAKHGLDRLQKWTFEVWNEPDMSSAVTWDYLTMYAEAARAIKSVSSLLRVGGPATAGLRALPQFVDRNRQAGVPFDFVSSHAYPNRLEDCPIGDESDPDCFATQVRKARASVADVPFFLTEYGTHAGLGYGAHDSTAAAAFIFRSVAQLNAHVELYSYSALSDVLFADADMPAQEFRNLFGMCTIGGLAKPAWRAFELLHQYAGDALVPTEVASQNALQVCNTTVEESAGEVQSEATECADAAPAESKNVITAFSTVNGTDADGSLRLFLSFCGAEPKESRRDRKVHVVVQHTRSGAPRSARAYRIYDENANAHKAWLAMGAPNVPSEAQMAELQVASEVGDGVPLEITAGNLNVSVTVVMSENSAVVVAFLDEQPAPALIRRDAN